MLRIVIMSIILAFDPCKNKIVESHFRKSEEREKPALSERSVKVLMSPCNDKVVEDEQNSRRIRNSSRDYFKNFDVEKFFTNMDGSGGSSSLENGRSVELCPSLVSRSGLSCLSPASAKFSPSIVKTSSTLSQASPRLTPEFVFACDKLTTELHSRVEEGNLDRVLQLLLDPVNGINYRDQRGVTPLHVAVRANNPRLVEILLLHGADPDMTDSHLRTSLHYAGLQASGEMMDVLLKFSVDYTAKEW